MSSRHRPPDPLAPIGILLACCTVLVIVLPILTMLAYGGHAHLVIGAWGSRTPCVEVPQSGLWLGEGPSGWVHGLRPGVVAGTPAHITLCQASMTGLDRALLSTPVVVNLVWVVGLFAQLWALARHGRREGLFTRSMARAVHRLGWYVLVGWLLVALLDAAMRAVVASHLVSGLDVLMVLPEYVHWNWAAVIAGVGTVSMGRVLVETVPMREEIEATV